MSGLARDGRFGRLVLAARSDPREYRPLSDVLGSRGRRAGSEPVRTTPPWSPSSASCRRTSSTAGACRPETSSVSPSSPGSRQPTTDDATRPTRQPDPRSITGHSTAPLMRPNAPTRPTQRKSEQPLPTPLSVVRSVKVLRRAAAKRTGTRFLISCPRPDWLLDGGPVRVRPVHLVR